VRTAHATGKPAPPRDTIAEKIPGWFSSAVKRLVAPEIREVIKDELSVVDKKLDAMGHWTDENLCV
jgi:hypothetical protein